MRGAAWAWQRVAGIDGFYVDAAVAVALTILTQVQIGPSDPAAHAAVLLTVALAFRRVAPFPVAAVSAIAIAAQGLVDNPPSVFGMYVSVTLAIYTVAAHCDLRRAVAGGLLIVVGIVLHDLPSEEFGSAAGIASDLVTPVAFWAVGRAVLTARSRTERAAAAAGALAREAVERERRHIARELHDAVTHSLGVMVLQAQGARRYLDGREPRVGTALEAVEQSGRSALVEMQRLLGLLRDEDAPAERAPQPRIARVQELAEQVRAAGMAVDVRVEGDEQPLEPGIDHSAYRIVQESLTNALRHSGASHVRILIRYAPAALEVEVVDDGRGSNGALAGRGLLGMRERVGFFGGTIEHGTCAGGGYRVWARLPAEADG